MYRKNSATFSAWLMNSRRMPSDASIPKTTSMLSTFPTATSFATVSSLPASVTWSRPMRLSPSRCVVTRTTSPLLSRWLRTTALPHLRFSLPRREHHHRADAFWGHKDCCRFNVSARCSSSRQAFLALAVSRGSVRRTIAIAAIAAILFLGVFLVPNSPTVSGAPVLKAYMTGLDFPVALAFSPDGRIFFAEIFTGNIWVIENGLLLPDPLYTLPNTAAFGEMGLLGLALHPQFSSEPWIYAYQTFNDTTSGTFYNRVVRIRAPGNIAVLHEVLLDQFDPD